MTYQQIYQQNPGMSANGGRTSANATAAGYSRKIKGFVGFGERWRMSTNAGGSSMWWARQDSNLQPDRYERSELAENPSKFNEPHAFLCTFVLVCSRGFCGVTVGQLSTLATSSADLKDALRATGVTERRRSPLAGLYRPRMLMHETGASSIDLLLRRQIRSCPSQILS